MPVPYCDYWTDLSLYTFITGSLLIGLAYYLIPIGLILVMRELGIRFTNVPVWATPVIGQLALFILFCGTSHLIEIFNVWWPLPRLRAFWSVGTATVSWMFLFTVIDAIKRYKMTSDGNRMG